MNLCCVKWTLFINTNTMLFLLLLNAFSSINAVAINYSELESANKTCAPRDTCVGGRTNRFGLINDWKSRNCFCDNLCAIYGDCCVDANAYDFSQQSTAQNNFKCVQLRNYEGVYMKSTCPADWVNDQISQNCQLGSLQVNSEDPDPMLYMPVTSKISRVTYRNYFCAVCNNDSIKSEVWRPRLECPSLTELKKKNELNISYIRDNLKFEDGNWGVTLKDSDVFHSCYIDPYLPETVVHMIRPCIDTTNTCADDWTDGEIREKCISYTSVVYENEKPFRNYHCALCNNARLELLYCEKHSFSRFNFRTEFSRTAFSLLFDFTDKSGSNIVGYSSSCDSNEIWDPFFKKCRNIICGKTGHEYRHGRCIDLSSGEVKPKSTTLVPTTTTTTMAPTTTIVVIAVTNDTSNLENNIPITIPEDTTTSPTDDFNAAINSSNNFGINNTLNNETDDLTTIVPIEETTILNIDPIKTKKNTLSCNRILLPESEYEEGNNNTVIVKLYGRTYQPNEYERHEGGILVCSVLPDSDKFSNVMGYITLLGLGISCICIIIHFIAFILVPDLRNLSGKNLCSLCLSLISAYACFILGVFGEAGKLECFILAAFMYYFFLASFCWMNVMAFDIWFTLRLATSELRVSTGRQTRKFLAYSLYGWLIPAAALIVLVVLDITKPNGISPNFLPEFGQRWGWFGQRKALLVFFATPLTAIMGINIILFIMAARMIASTTNSTAKMSTSAPYQNQCKLYMRLALLMGLTWISGIVAGYLQLEPIWYIFIILNTLQGLFIFAAFTCTRKVCRAFGGSCWRKIKVARHTSTSWPGMTTSSSSRKGLESQDSNHSHLSHSSMAQLTTNTSRSNVDSF